MSNKNEVFEYLIDQLRQQLPVVDVMGEIKRWSIDRSIVGRGIYTDEENVIIDTYIDLEHNPYKQQCEDLAHEVQSLKNQLRDMSALVAELQETIKLMNEDFNRVTNRCGTLPKGVSYVVGEHGPEQSGCRKEDTQERKHNWLRSKHRTGFFCSNCGARKECEHEWQFYGVGFPCMCLKCGLKK